MTEEIRVEIIDDISGGDYSKLLTRAVKETLKYEGIFSPVDVSLSIVYKDEIRRLNAEYRDIDKVTDVLSFPLIELYGIENKPQIIADNAANMMYESTLLGDVILCFDVAKAQADEYGHSLERELAFLTVHSILHLLGYDHIIDDEDIIMREKQRDIMKILDLEIK